MTGPDPEEHDGRNDASRRGRPDDLDAAATDAAFASIISDWRDDPDLPQWPSDTDQADTGPQAWRAGAQPDDTFLAEPQPAAGHPAPARPDPYDEGHFEPPEPPPLPIPRPRTMLGVILLAVGLLLLVRPSVLMLGESTGTPLGLLSITAGIAWLVLGLRAGPPPEGWDDGARL